MIQLDSRPSSCSTTITITAAALLGLGVVMVFSASASLSAPPLTHDVLKNPTVRQAMFTFVALVALLMVGLCPYHSWQFRSRAWMQPSLLLMVGTFVLLVLVLVPGIGEERKGAQRWLPLGPSALGLGFQPSEIAKVSVVIFLAAYCAWLGNGIRKFWKGYLPTIMLLGFYAALVGIEDFGTAALIGVVGFGIILAAGAKLWHLFITSLPAVAGAVYLILDKPYRVQRLLSFLNPEADPQGAGYHQIQSLVTIASGNWWGLGLGNGVQKYGYLPEGRTDFIFAVICEELGIIGGIAVIALFGIILWQGKRAMVAAPTEFGRLLALGATLTIGFQAAMNIAVVTVSVPTKGIGLPFVSAGGTGVIFFSILVGMLVNVARYRRPGLDVQMESSVEGTHETIVSRASERDDASPQVAAMLPT
ncbi:MAG TPA: FtsW/RodA/SpoVE family cell cycle protein [Phycisphaerae bacterium]|nr:FtsW/RodA/SpoVE family cell cycle protein [Phycisphaerae bacterium]